MQPSSRGAILQLFEKERYRIVEPSSEPLSIDMDSTTEIINPRISETEWPVQASRIFLSTNTRSLITSNPRYAWPLDKLKTPRLHIHVWGHPFSIRKYFYTRTLLLIFKDIRLLSHPQSNLHCTRSDIFGVMHYLSRPIGRLRDKSNETDSCSSLFYMT